MPEQAKATPEKLAEFIRQTVDPLITPLRADLQQLGGRLGDIDSLTQRVAVVELAQPGGTEHRQLIERLREAAEQIQARVQRVEQAQAGAAPAAVVSRLKDELSQESPELQAAHLTRSIGSQIDDEILAVRIYTELADAARRLGWQYTSDILSRIAKDEEQHEALLKEAVTNLARTAAGEQPCDATSTAAGESADPPDATEVEAWVGRIEQGKVDQHDLALLQRVIDEVDRREALLVQQNSPAKEPVEQAQELSDEPYLLVSKTSFPGAIQEPSLNNRWVKVVCHGV